jgi:hypothetical protein
LSGLNFSRVRFQLQQKTFSLQNEIRQIEELVQKPKTKAVSHRRFGVSDFGRNFSGLSLSPVEVFDESESLLASHDSVVTAVDEISQDQN